MNILANINKSKYLKPAVTASFLGFSFIIKHFYYYNKPKRRKILNKVDKDEQKVPCKDDYLYLYKFYNDIKPKNIEIYSSIEIDNKDNLFTIVSHVFAYLKNIIHYEYSNDSFIIIISDKKKESYHNGIIYIDSSIINSTFYNKVNQNVLIVNEILKEILPNQSHSSKEVVINNSILLYISYNIFFTNKEQYKNELLLFEYYKHKVILSDLSDDSFCINDYIEHNIKHQTEVSLYKLGFFLIYNTSEKLNEIITLYLKEQSCEQFLSSLVEGYPLLSIFIKKSKVPIFEVIPTNNSISIYTKNIMPYELSLSLIEIANNYNKTNIKVTVNTSIQDIPNNKDNMKILTFVDSEAKTISIQNYNKNELDFILKNILSLLDQITDNLLFSIIRNLFFIINGNVNNESVNKSISEIDFVDLCLSIIESNKIQNISLIWYILSCSIYFISNDYIGMFSYETIMTILNKLINDYIIKYPSLIDIFVNFSLDIIKDNEMLGIVLSKIEENEIKSNLSKETIERIREKMNDYNSIFYYWKDEYKQLFDNFPYYDNKDTALVYYQSMIDRCSFMGKDNPFVYFKMAKKLNKISKEFLFLENNRIVLYFILKDSYFIINRILKNKNKVK